MSRQVRSFVGRIAYFNPAFDYAHFIAVFKSGTRPTTKKSSLPGSLSFSPGQSPRRSGFASQPNITNIIMILLIDASSAHLVWFNPGDKNPRADAVEPDLHKHPFYSKHYKQERVGWVGVKKCETWTSH